MAQVTGPRRLGEPLRPPGHPPAPPGATATPSTTPGQAPPELPRGAHPTTTPGQRRRARLAAVLAVLLLLAGAAVWQVTRPDTPALTRADVDRAVQQGIERAQQEQRRAPPDAALVYRTIMPSLVTITTRGSDGTGLGTGVVVNAEGAILTALHVVDGEGGQIQVRFSDGTQANATVVTRRPADDIAVLSADRQPQIVVPAVLGGGVGVGDPVYPVGNPLGLTGSLTAGVVSATERTVRIEGGATLRRLIQFDAAVNPGNSGGPLLDRSGQVVGIVTGLANPARQPYFVGIGFAVPIASAGGAVGAPAR